MAKPIPDAPLGVAISGTGSILKEMIQQGLHIGVVFSDRDCAGLLLAEAARIPTVVVRRTNFGPSFNREGYTERVVDMLREYRIRLLAMAGFMTILGRRMFDGDAFPGKVLNTHPSLLPAFPGDNAVQEALDFGVRVTGCTVHIAVCDVDAGPILAQTPVRVIPGDTKERLHERIKKAERRLYPAVVRKSLEALGVGKTIEEVFG